MGTSLLEDLRSAGRSLAREPRFTVLVSGVLAAGIALTVGVFAVVDAYLLSPLPFPEAERLVAVRDARNVSWEEVDHVFEKAVSWDLDVSTGAHTVIVEFLRADGVPLAPAIFDRIALTATG